MTERLIVVPYDPDWPRRFERERAVLATIFAGSGADIRHVGSTAVHGLGAQPVIDVMVGVSQSKAFSRLRFGTMMNGRPNNALHRTDKRQHGISSPRAERK